MYQVLSIQMARSFGESSEFVTKRVCFSSLFCAGFLCVLGGFFLGRFAAERPTAIQAKKTKLELAGNGLESIGHIQDVLIRQLAEASIQDFQSGSSEEETQKVKNILNGLGIIRNVFKNESYVVGKVQGSRESDRYIVLSVDKDNSEIVLELARIFDKIHKDYNWKLRRTIVFCFFFGSSDVCHEVLPNYIRSKILAYIAVRGKAIQVNERLVASGSDIVLSTVLQAIKLIENPITESAAANGKKTIFDTYEDTNRIVSLSRLKLDIPHVILSFMGFKNTSRNETNHTGNVIAHRRALAQIIGLSVWRFSESTILYWNPEILNKTVNQALDSLYIPALLNIKDTVSKSIHNLTQNAENLNKKINTMERSKPLEVRMINDLLMDLDRALLCPDTNFNSKTDLYMLHTYVQGRSIETHLKELLNCYNLVNQLLQDK
ncbi:transferrin receptor protein 1 [Cephus cinctus]|uniref:Transferrin receptor protein 1 n=1 Tax=Cephus cinctus TaxID=211228 RepID=A0AAJ7BQ04_CEPCN|nr:transferrin receptor protein 1 [Cephus cinctus]